MECNIIMGNIFNHSNIQPPPNHLSQDWLHILFDLLHWDLILKNCPSWSVSRHFLLKKIEKRKSISEIAGDDHCILATAVIKARTHPCMVCRFPCCYQVIKWWCWVKIIRRGKVTMAKTFQPLIPDIWSILRRWVGSSASWAMTDDDAETSLGWVEQWVGQSTDDNAEMSLGGVFGEQQSRSSLRGAQTLDIARL